MRDETTLLNLVREALVEVKPAVADRAVNLGTSLYPPEDPTASADDLGFDSLDALDLVTLLEEKLDLRLTGDVDLLSVRTVADVIATIRYCESKAEEPRFIASSSA